MDAFGGAECVFLKSAQFVAFFARFSVQLNERPHFKVTPKAALKAPDVACIGFADGAPSHWFMAIRTMCFCLSRVHPTIAYHTLLTKANFNATIPG